jgi:electron-transferring-flavoprotein dehydrogenase
MLAAETIFAALALEGAAADAELARYGERMRKSWLWDELHRGRNFSAGIARFGTFAGGALAFVEQNLLRGRAPWTLHNRIEDHARLREAADAPRPRYAKPDGVVAFDRSSSVFLSSTAHEENQPSHRSRNPDVPSQLPRYDSPRSAIVRLESRVSRTEAGSRAPINATNCVHCKTCDIKDPAQNITWVPPEGGGGPNYSGM